MVSTTLSFPKSMSKNRLHLAVIMHLGPVFYILLSGLGMLNLEPNNYIFLLFLRIIYNELQAKKIQVPVRVSSQSGDRSPT